MPTRSSAPNMLAMHAPAPVIAAALGYADETAEHHRLAAGGAWSRYATLLR